MGHAATFFTGYILRIDFKSLAPSSAEITTIPLKIRLQTRPKVCIIDPVSLASIGDHFSETLAHSAMQSKLECTKT